MKQKKTDKNKNKGNSLKRDKSDPKNQEENKEMDEKNKRKFTKPKIPRNVNEYLHFLKHEYITENDCEWVLSLRNIE